MKVAIGCDHIVTDIKNHVKKYIENKGFEVVDCGTYDFTRTHYPIYGKKVGELVSNHAVDCGIVLCGTGVGISNAVSKMKGVRCALVGDVQTTKYMKEELDCNVLAFGGRVLGIGMIEDIIDTYFESEYKGNNVDLISKINELGFVNNDSDFFDEFLVKWEKGEYHD